MKKIITCILLALSTYAIADEKSYAGYLNLDANAMAPFPLVGVGIRSQKGMHGIDVAGNIIPVMPNDFSHATYHLKGLYLFYPNQKGLYLGAGLGIVNQRENLDRTSGSLECACGYQWNTSQNSMIFLEANMITPFQKPTGIRVWPGLTFGFGF